MAETQLIIFDCDGVLVDSEGISSRVLAHTLTAGGLPTSARQARERYQGLMLDEVGAAAQAQLGAPLPSDWIAAFERTRACAFRRELQPVQGAAEAVRALAAAGLQACVASQGKLEKTRLSLQLTGLAHLFSTESIFSAYQVPRGKPAPDLFLHAAASMGAAPARCLVVEDSPSGVSAAVAAGMPVLGYAEQSDAAALTAAGAEILRSLADLPGVLGIGAAGATGSPNAGPAGEAAGGGAGGADTAAGTGVGGAGATAAAATDGGTEGEATGAGETGAAAGAT